MKPILVIIGNTTKVFTQETTEAIHKYWAQKKIEMESMEIEDSVIESSYNEFLNVLNKFWFRGVVDPFISDLPDELQRPEMFDFEFNYLEDKVTITCHNTEVETLLLRPMDIDMNDYDSDDFEDSDSSFNHLEEHDRYPGKDHYDQAALENQSPE